METGDSQQNTAAGANAHVDFAIGKSDKDTGKAKVKGIDEIAEERMK